MKSQVSEEERRLLTRTAMLYYEHGMEQRDIANRLGQSQSTISRWIKTAHELGIVKVTIDGLSRESRLEDKLVNDYSLFDARVVLSSGTEEGINLKTELAIAAADYFMATVRDGWKLAYSGGETLYLTALRLPYCPKLDIYPFYLGGSRSSLVDFINPSVLVTLLWERSKGMARAYSLCMPPYETEEPEAEKQQFLERPEVRRIYGILQNDLDVLFSGIGSVSTNSLLVRFAQQSYGIGMKELEAQKVIGDISHILFDKAGREVKDTPIQKGYIGVSYETVKRMVRDPNKRVIVVGGGKEKVCAIHTALKYGLADTIITDSTTAFALRDSSEVKSP